MPQRPSAAEAAEPSLLSFEAAEKAAEAAEKAAEPSLFGNSPVPRLAL